MTGFTGNRLRIRTPEGVEFSFELAGPLSRFLAWVVDLIVVLMILKLIMVPLQMLIMITPGLGFALNAIAYFVISIGYGMALEWRLKGQTLGKRLLHIRVIDEQGLPLSFPQLAMRNLLRAVDALPALYLVGGVCCVLSPKMQRLGDLAAATVVTRIPDLREPDLSAIGSSKYNSFLDYGHLAARLRQGVSPTAAETALQALIRRNALDPGARVRLFHDIAAHFREVVAFPPEATDGLSDEQYARNVVEIVFASHRHKG